MDATQGPSETLADRLRILRQEAGLTKTALATPDYTVSYVSQIESGRRHPSSDALRFFARRLETSEQFLRTGIPDGLEEQIDYDIEEVRLLLGAARWDEAYKRVLGVLDRAGRYGLTGRWALASALAGHALVRLGRVREAIDRFEAALEAGLLERERGLVTAVLARVYAMVGDLAYAAQLIESFLGTQTDRPLDPAVAAELHTVLISIYFERGDIVRAERVAKRALLVVDHGVSPRVRADALWSASRVLAETKRLDEALDLATRARVIIEELGDQWRLVGIHTAYAFLCLESDPPRTAEAEQHLDSAETLLRDGPPSSQHLSHLHAERGRLELLQGNAQGALKHSERALEHVGEDRLERGRCLFLQGRALSQLDRHQESIDSFHEAAAAFAKSGARQQEASCWREIGEIELEAGRVDSAVDALRSGLQALEPERSRA